MKEIKEDMLRLYDFFKKLFSDPIKKDRNKIKSV